MNFADKWTNVLFVCSNSACQYNAGTLLVYDMCFTINNLKMPIIHIRLEIEFVLHECH